MEKTAKQQAIEKSYGEHWDECKEYVDENGFLRLDYSDTGKKLHIKMWRIAKQNGWHLKDIRPASLNGLSNNNGWIKIESEEDLPNEGDNRPFKVLDIHGNKYEPMQYDGSYWTGYDDDIPLTSIATHYKAIEPELLPIY